MPTEALTLLTALVFIVGLLYSSVGHAGASGYLAAMALVSVAPDVMKPTALVLNILVAIIGTLQFWRAGHFDWRLFWPFAITSIPLAFLGGRISLPANIYKPIIGAVLLFSAWRIAAGSLSRTTDSAPSRPPALPLALLTGAILGFISGLTGVGGGIFLSPILILLHWADTKRTAAVSAAFILVNSISGIAGIATAKSVHLPPASMLASLAIAAGVGGLIGSYFGSRKLNTLTIRRLLAVVLIIAGAKLVWEALKQAPAKSGGAIPQSPTSAAPAAQTPAP